MHPLWEKTSVMINCLLNGSFTLIWSWSVSLFCVRQVEEDLRRLRNPTELQLPVEQIQPKPWTMPSHTYSHLHAEMQKQFFWFILIKAPFYQESIASCVVFTVLIMMPIYLRKVQTPRTVEIKWIGQICVMSYYLNLKYSVILLRHNKDIRSLHTNKMKVFW